jgi:hypothetical protein
MPLNSIEIGEKVGKVRLDKTTAVGKAIKTYECNGPRSILQLAGDDSMSLPRMEREEGKSERSYKTPAILLLESRGTGNSEAQLQVSCCWMHGCPTERQAT